MRAVDGLGAIGVAGPPSVFAAAALEADGPVAWGTPVRCRRPGVYVIATPDPLPAAPIDEPAVEAWIRRVPGICVDGVPATLASLCSRLRAF